MQIMLCVCVCVCVDFFLSIGAAFTFAISILFFEGIYDLRIFTFDGWVRGVHTNGARNATTREENANDKMTIATTMAMPFDNIPYITSLNQYQYYPFVLCVRYVRTFVWVYVSPLVSDFVLHSHNTVHISNQIRWRIKYGTGVQQKQKQNGKLWQNGRKRDGAMNGICWMVMI